MSNQLSSEQEEKLINAFLAKSAEQSIEEEFIQFARLYAEQIQSKWLPIESAPKGYDHPYTKYKNNQRPRNSQFILFGNEHHIGVGWVMIREDYDQEENELLSYVDETGQWIDPIPTHWQPLPLPPTPQP